jgi:hypothetical protein
LRHETRISLTSAIATATIIALASGIVDATWHRTHPAAVKITSIGGDKKPLTIECSYGCVVQHRGEDLLIRQAIPGEIQTLPHQLEELEKPQWELEAYEARP